MTDRRPGRPSLPNGERARQCNLALYPPQREWLEQESKRRGCTMSAIVQGFIDVAMAQEQQEGEK